MGVPARVRRNVERARLQADSSCAGAAAEARRPLAPHAPGARQFVVQLAAVTMLSVSGRYLSCGRGCGHRVTAA